MQVCLALPYAARNLDADQSRALCEAIARWQASMAIAELDDEAAERWWQVLAQLLEDVQADRRVVGLAGRLLHEAGRIDNDRVQALMQRMLSPGEQTEAAARFFEGFFEEAASQLLHQPVLREGVDAWLRSLDGETFQAQLPLLRRVFSTLDGNERRILLQRVMAPQGATDDGMRLEPAHMDEWRAHCGRLQALLGAREVAWPT